MGSNAQKALILAAGLFLTVALITIAVVIFTSAQDSAKKAQQTLTDLQTEIADTEYTVYDNATLTGSQVVNAIRKYDGRDYFGIVVTTGSGIEWYGRAFHINPSEDTYGDEVDATDHGWDLTEALDESDDDYINPNGKFDALIHKNSNNVVVCIQFTQK